jgi:DNA polymerase I-like protein with 3'-5' exonuclease and polymerase domains
MGKMIDPRQDISAIQIGRPLSIETLELIEIGKLPNQRTLIIPDANYSIVDMDLDRADAQFVAWEANDETLKQILKAGADLHLENARAIWGEHVKKKDPERQLAKRFCHAVNYGAYPKRLAKALGITIKLAEWIYNRWFQIHPGIREWHNRTKAQLYSERLVRNPFGYERYYFDRPENVLNEALAWVPQSSVGIIINTAWDRIDSELPEVEVLMQVHDSLTMQVPSKRVQELLPKIQEKSLVAVPYDDPLIIPVGFKVSEKSWGDVEPPCCEEMAIAPVPYRVFLDDKGKRKVEGCKDHGLHNKLMQGLANVKKEAASNRLAR